MDSKKLKTIKELKSLISKIENNEIKLSMVSHMNYTEKQEIKGIRNGKPEFILQYEYINKDELTEFAKL